ncbi:MAG: Crp/Fnr family transcriptional regulator [Gemmatimonadetes bacterium]|nr:Crp/Fnr family transcriptional regulator [Gemmatimonadota bacterium]
MDYAQPYVSHTGGAVSLVSDDRAVPRNKLLSSMKAAAFERLRPALHTVDVQANELLGEAEVAPAFVYFPNTAVLSVLRSLGDESYMEVASIGHEGMNALPLFLGADRMPSRSRVRTAGTAIRMARADFIAASNEDGLLSVALRRYAALLLADVERAVVCTRFHTIPQQFASWILYSADRVGRDDFALTHDSVASLFGVRRATISEAAGDLKRLGVIRTGRGRIAIHDRAQLRAAACVCYGKRNDP